MYPLNAILIGSDESVCPSIRRELMARSAHLEAEYPDVGRATADLRRSSAEKRLVFLHITDSQDLEALARLTIYFPGWPVITVVDEYDSDGSQGKVIAAIMRAGASQILSLPIDPGHFKEAMDRIAIQFVYSVRDTKVIAVAGVIGGSGATSIALNLAYEIAHTHGFRCILADLSLRMGMIAPHLDIEPEHTITDLLRDVKRVDTLMAQKVLIKVADKFEILAGPNRLTTPTKALAQDVARVVDTLKQITDIVVLDVPCNYDDIYFETLAAAGQTILVGEQKLPSIRALKMVHEAINRPSGSEHVAINRYDPKNKGFVVERILNPLGVSSVHTVARDDLGMNDSVNLACVLRLAAPSSPALADILVLADHVLDVAPQPKVKKSPGLFSRLGRALVNT